MSTDNHNKFIASEIELIYKSSFDPEEAIKVVTSQDAYQFFRNVWDPNKIDFIEQSKALLLNRANHFLGVIDVSSGGISGTVVDARIVFAAALKANASSIVLAHNHPSGNLTPSHADLTLTHTMQKAGKFLSIPLLDHLIITRQRYHSIADDDGMREASTTALALS